MDSRAKQRLTGAIILVALFVLLVPELLTGPKGAATPGAPDEEGMRRYTIDLNAANPAAPPSESQTPPPAVALPQPVSETGLAKPGEEAAAATEPAPVVAAPPPATSTAPAPVVQAPAAAPAPRVETPKPAAPSPAATAPVAAAPVAAEKGSFAVQLGSFSSRENSDRLVRDMTAKGFAAFVAPIKSGDRMLYRVRVGPTRDRAQAEALAAQLRRVGQSGAIVPIS